jgi:hypothetical protein
MQLMTQVGCYLALCCYNLVLCVELARCATVMEACRVSVCAAAMTVMRRSLMHVTMQVGCYYDIM